jgi:hypothetical protein
MKEQAQVIRLKQQEAPYICSACGADRGCDCNAPAVEKLAAYRERERQKKARQRARAKAVPGDTNVENTEESGRLAILARRQRADELARLKEEKEAPLRHLRETEHLAERTVIDALNELDVRRRFGPAPEGDERDDGPDESEIAADLIEQLLCSAMETGVSTEALFETFCRRAGIEAQEARVTESTSPIFQPNLDKEEFRKVKAVADAHRHEGPQKQSKYLTRYAHYLLGALTDSTPEVRSAAVKELVSGKWQSEFEAVTEAVGDLYQQLSKAGR